MLLVNKIKDGDCGKKGANADRKGTFSINGRLSDSSNVPRSRSTREKRPATLRISTSRTRDGRTSVFLQETLVAEMIGEKTGLAARPSLKGGNKLRLVDQSDLKSNQPEEQMPFGVDGHGESPCYQTLLLDWDGVRRGCLIREYRGSTMNSREIADDLFGRDQIKETHTAEVGEESAGSSHRRAGNRASQSAAFPSDSALARAVILANREAINF